VTGETQRRANQDRFEKPPETPSSSKFFHLQPSKSLMERVQKFGWCFHDENREEIKQLRIVVGSQTHSVDFN